MKKGDNTSVLSFSSIGSNLADEGILKSFGIQRKNIIHYERGLNDCRNILDKKLK